MPIAIGQNLGNYVVVSKLGSGGMGAVWLAEHPLIGKKVALKVIHKDLSMNAEVVTRFFNEARAVNQIGNDHIVEIFDYGQTPEGEYFLIMELLSGKCLGDVLEQERILDPRRAIHIGAQIADALAASHASGIIHRDLKPDNVYLVTKLGEPDFVKVLDFGLAKLSDNPAGNLTKQGVILGTPQYMSPEQCESKGRVDHRSDVYALGIMLFQMTTGQIPFDGGTMGEILVKHVAMPAPAPRAVNPHVPPSVEQIILRCLSKRAEERFQTMGDLKAALLDPDAYLRSGWSAPTAGMPGLSEGSRTMAGKALRMSGPTPAQASTALAMQAPMAYGQPQVPTVPAPGFLSPMPASTGMTGAHAPLGYDNGPSRAFPALQLPAQVSSSTMLLDPDVAAGRPQRKGGRRWVVGLVFIVLAAALTVVGLLVVQKVNGHRDGNATAAESAPPAPSKPAEPPAPVVIQGAPPPTPAPASSAPASSAAASAPAPAPVPAPAPPEPVASASVKVSLATDPSGAQVLDEKSGTSLGTTPVELLLERGSDHALVFKHDGFAEKHKLVHAAGNSDLLIVLDKLDKPKAVPAQSPVQSHPPRQHRPKDKTKPDKQNSELLEPTL